MILARCLILETTQNQKAYFDISQILCIQQHEFTTSIFVPSGIIEVWKSAKDIIEQIKTMEETK